MDFIVLEISQWRVRVIFTVFWSVRDSGHYAGQAAFCQMSYLYTLYTLLYIA